MSPQFGETVYIFEVHGARNVKSDARVAINKNLDQCIIFSLAVIVEDIAPNSIFFTKLLELSETSRARKLMFISRNLQCDYNVRLK